LKLNARNDPNVAPQNKTVEPSVHHDEAGGLAAGRMVRFQTFKIAASACLAYPIG
jgi:hypothetical protein